MKKIVFIILCCSLIAGVYTGCGSKPKNENQTETPVKTNKADAPKDKLVKLAEETNKKMPMPMPGGIRMDKAEAVSKTEFKYYYTFTQAPVVSAEEFTRNTRPALTLALQSAKGDDLDLFKKEKMTLVYAYYTLDGNLDRKSVV